GDGPRRAGAAAGIHDANRVDGDEHAGRAGLIDGDGESVPDVDVGGLPVEERPDRAVGLAGADQEVAGGRGRAGVDDVGDLGPVDVQPHDAVTGAAAGAVVGQGEVDPQPDARVAGVGGVVARTAGVHRDGPGSAGGGADLDGGVAAAVLGED